MGRLVGMGAKESVNEKTDKKLVKEVTALKKETEALKAQNEALIKENEDLKAKK